jgi:hypothetical protein
MPSAAAMCYMMIHQQDPVGLITFDQKVRDSLPPKSKRKQLGNVLSLLARLKPTGETDIGRSLIQKLLENEQVKIRALIHKTMIPIADPRLEFFDLRENDLAGFLKDVEALYHLAFDGESPENNFLLCGHLIHESGAIMFHGYFVQHRFRVSVWPTLHR